MARQAVFDYVTDFFTRVLQPDFKAFYPYKSNLWQMSDILPDHPGSVDHLLDQFKEKIELNGMHDGCGRLIAGFNPNSGNYPSGLGVLYMMLANIHNNSAWRAVVDKIILRWLFCLVGYDQEPGGFFTSGGTSASIVAMMAAREAADIPIADSDRAVVYLTDTVHNCVDKALKAAGFTKAIFRQVRYDSQRKMVVSDLNQKIQQDLKDKLKPFLVIATMGEVESGAIDPLADIADIAAQYDMWFHVDAAYGGFFLMCDEIKERAIGVEKADSVIINLHKGLFQPFGSAAVLFKTGVRHRIRQLFANMKPPEETSAQPLITHPIEDHSPFRGFPAWMFLNVLGMKHVRALTLEKIKLCNYLYDYLKLCSGISVPIKPELSKLIFALENDDVDEANRRTEELCQALNSDGTIVVDTTKTDGRVYIHMCMSALRTHIGDVDYFLMKLRDVVKEKFNLDLPDVKTTTSQEMLDDLRHMEKIYVTMEKTIAKKEVPALIANAAEGFKNNLTATQHILRGFNDYSVPYLEGEVSSSSHNKYGRDQKGPKATFDIPENPRSWEDILYTLSCSPVDETNGVATHDQTLLEPAIMGCFLVTSLNRFPAQRVSSPGHIELEEIIPDWLRTVTGFPDTAKGVLYNDSCSADMLCLFTARCTRLPHPRMYERAIVYGSLESLQAISQPLHVIGLSRCQKTVIKSIDGQLLDIQSLMETMQYDLQLRSKDIFPFLIVLSISSSGLGASSGDLKALMAICRKEGVWVHVHVSEGAPFLLADLGPCAAMTESGLSAADSISINLTECMCQPQEVAAVLVRDHTLLLNSLQPQREANYFRDVTTIEYEPAAYSLELTRPSRAMAVWFAMYLHGADRLRQHIASLRNRSTS